MRKISAVALVALFAIIPAAHAATTTKTVSTTWVDNRTGIVYDITCNETQVINGNNRTESFDCTPDGAKPPAGTYNSPSAFWNSDFDGSSARKVHVTIDNNGRLQGQASDFQPNTIT